MWLADKCSSVKKPAHNGLFLVQKYKIQLLYSLNCQTKTINCHYKFSTSKCVKAHIHEWINRIHIYWIFIIILRYHVLCIYMIFMFWVMEHKSQMLLQFECPRLCWRHCKTAFWIPACFKWCNRSLLTAGKSVVRSVMILSALSFEEFWAWKILVICTIIKIWNMICTEE